jgi:hypothetical protein
MENGVLLVVGKKVWICKKLDGPSRDYEYPLFLPSKFLRHLTKAQNPGFYDR